MANTIAASFGLDIAPLQHAAARAVATGRKMAADLNRDLGAAASKLASGAARRVESLGLAALAAGAGLAVGVHHAYELGSHLQDLHDKTGIAADQMMILNQAAKDNGLEDISGAVSKLQRNLVDAVKNGASPAAEALDLLGLNATDLARALPADAIDKIGAKIRGIENPALKSATAMALFGKKGAELLPLFADAGAIGTAAKSIGRQAQILRENAARFDAVSDRLNRSGLKLQGFFVGVAEKVLPLMEAATARLDALDLAAQGEKFGAGIRTGVDLLAGAFADPKNLLEGFEAGLLASCARAGNFMGTALVKAGLRFNAIMSESVGLLADALPRLKNAALGLVGLGDLEPQSQRPRNKFLDSAEDFRNQADHLQVVDIFGAAGYEAAAAAATHRAADAGKKIVDAFVGGATTAVEGPKKFTSSSRLNTRNDGLRTSSLAGAAGGEAFTEFFSAGNNKAVGRYSPLSRGAFNVSNAGNNVLDLSERRAFENAAVANGRPRRASTSGAFGAIRAGDKARERAVAKEQAREKLGVEKTNALLEVINGTLKEGLLDE